MTEELAAIRWRNEPVRADAEDIPRLVAATGFFTAEEVAIARELVEARLAKGIASGYEFALCDLEGDLAGYACYGRTPGTDHSFDLYWIVVSPRHQGRGLGQAILARIEPLILSAGGRRLWVDTSSTDRYAATRAFYAGAGFREAARLADFYRPGDDKVIYEKRLA